MNGPLSLVLPAAMTLVLLPATALTPTPAHAQSQVEESNPYLQWPTRGAPGAPTVSRTEPNRYRTTDWAQRIDDTWGPSPLTIPQMLDIFDTFWSRVDRTFPCFQGLTVDWTALRDHYRPQVEAGVSRGRFAAIMRYMSIALRESHTQARDLLVANNTVPDPGVPLLYLGGFGDDRHFGAGLTPLPDSSLLVYAAMPTHPLGLVPGDIVLGYEGIPWKQLIHELLAAELPITDRWWWGSCDQAFTHSLLSGAGQNWHLFSTIDVVKYATGDTVHLSLAPMIGATVGGDWTEQLAIPGVPKPDYLSAGDRVSWGIIDGTQIAYIYVREWTGNAGVDFTNAVDSVMTQFETVGLIIDFRTNYGGNMFLAYDALRLLFDQDVSTIGFSVRCNDVDHFSMCLSPTGAPSLYVIHGASDNRYYDHPIAVLTGPGALSSGDQVANLMKYHPRSRFFGKSTSTAFNASQGYSVGYPSWAATVARADAYRVSDPTNYLTHDELSVDEPVWLQPQDVANGLDTVVEAAKAWIRNSTTGTLLARFEATTTVEGIELRWRFAEANRVAQTTVERARHAAGPWVTIAPELHDESGATVALDRTADESGDYFYRLAVVLTDGGRMVFGPISASHRELLMSNDPMLVSPNPTRDGAQMEYAVARAGRVRLEVLDVSGRVEATLADRVLEAGRYVAAWDGAGPRGRIAPGLHFVRLVTPDQVTLKKLTIIR